jgi:hypothetical protein
MVGDRRRYNITSEEDLRQAGDKLAAYVGTLPTTKKIVPLSTATNGSR